VKKISISALMIIMIICLFTPQAVYANMAAPSLSDVGSAITFEKNEEIAVLSEILNITVSGAMAHIVATYKMKNTTHDSISTQSMFLSPNIEGSDVSVMVNSESVGYIAKSYARTYSIAESYARDYSTGWITTHDWQYAVLEDKNATIDNALETIDTILFQMSFAPNEEYDVVVSYNYRLGGYPNYNFDAKDGRIYYFLAPAALWKDFSNLTINLYLDKDMPTIQHSNLEFRKIRTRTYQYTSDKLPDGKYGELEIIIDENGWQSFWSSLRSPYLGMMLMMLSPIILIILIILAVIIFIVRHDNNRKNAKLNRSDQTERPDPD
jgi:hypothetical protein